MHRIVLKRGREDSLLRKHPWVFSGAIDSVAGSPGPGETVEVTTHRGEILGRGAYSPRSQISVRMWTFDADTPVDAGLFRDRLAAAADLRLRVGVPERGTAWRMVNAEADGLPGLVADRYGDVLVFQVLAAGAEAHREELLRELASLGPWRAVVERSEAGMRDKEGLPPRAGVVSGDLPDARVPFTEHGCAFTADVLRGHKTGFYLDQAENRRAVATLARGRSVLNVFSYTGAFGIACLKAGAASVVQVDASQPALEAGRLDLEANQLPSSAVEDVCGNAFNVLRALRETERTFDLVVLDPPKFADARRRVPKAARAYKDINFQAFHLLRPGGLLATFSCSGALEEPLFQKIVADAALDAGREAAIVRRLGQAADHPVALPFPEARYLKGLLCAVR